MPMIASNLIKTPNRQVLVTTFFCLYSSHHMQC